MKKITIEQAKKLLAEGKVVQCRISSRDVVPVRNEAKLEDLIRLKELGVQSADFFIEGVQKLPKNAMEVSMEDAIDLIYKGEIVYGRKLGEEDENDDEELTTRSALIQFYRSAMVNGSAVLYWMP